MSTNILIPRSDFDYLTRMLWLHRSVLYVIYERASDASTLLGLLEIEEELPFLNTHEFTSRYFSVIEGPCLTRLMHQLMSNLNMLACKGARQRTQWMTVRRNLRWRLLKLESSKRHGYDFESHARKRPWTWAALRLDRAGHPWPVAGCLGGLIPCEDGHVVIYLSTISRRRRIETRTREQATGRVIAFGKRSTEEPCLTRLMHQLTSSLNMHEEEMAYCQGTGRASVLYGNLHFFLGASES